MTEYAAICIVFTLQGLHTCTHSPRRQPADNSDRLRGTGLLRTRLTATTPSCPPRLGCILSQEVALELCGPTPCHPELYKAHATPASGLPRTTLLLTGLVTRITSSDRVHPHSG